MLLIHSWLENCKRIEREFVPRAFSATILCVVMWVQFLILGLVIVIMMYYKNKHC